MTRPNMPNKAGQEEICLLLKEMMFRSWQTGSNGLPWAIFTTWINFMKTLLDYLDLCTPYRQKQYKSQRNGRKLEFYYHFKGTESPLFLYRLPCQQI